MFLKSTIPLPDGKLSLSGVIISRNSGKSMAPEPSLSTSWNIFLIWSLLGSKPSARITPLSSFWSMLPEPSVSNRSNADLSSFFCLSVRFYLRRRSGFYVDFYFKSSLYLEKSNFGGFINLKVNVFWFSITLSMSLSSMSFHFFNVFPGGGTSITTYSFLFFLVNTFGCAKSY